MELLFFFFGGGIGLQKLEGEILVDIGLDSGQFCIKQIFNWIEFSVGADRPRMFLVSQNVATSFLQCSYLRTLIITVYDRCY